MRLFDNGSCSKIKEKIGTHQEANYLRLKQPQKPSDSSSSSSSAWMLFFAATARNMSEGQEHEVAHAPGSCFGTSFVADCRCGFLGSVLGDGREKVGVIGGPRVAF